MSPQSDTPEPPKTLSGHFLKALREAHAWRPISFYLLLTIPIVLVLAVPLFPVREHPGRFALHLALLFIFLFVIIFRAALDSAEIMRRHHAEHQKAFRQALGEGRAPSPAQDGPDHDREA